VGVLDIGDRHVFTNNRIKKGKMMKTILAALAGLLGTGLLAYLCATGHRDLIQHDLSGRAKSILASSTVSDLNVSADGRELTLHGVVPSQQAKLDAGETVGKLYGVHNVINLLEVRKPVVPLVPVPPVATVTPVPEVTPDVRQSKVVPPKPPHPPVKVKPVTPAVPARREALASLPRSKETTISPSRCQDALAATLGRRQIYFESNKAIIRPVSYPVLDRLAEAARNCPARSIEISGHTDRRGTLRANMALSKSRAQAVMNYLIKKGVPAERLIAVSYGPAKPVIPNATAAEMQRNRRVEFTIKGEERDSEKKVHREKRKGLM